MDRWTDLARARTSTGDELVLRERAGCIELRCNGWELMSNRAHHSEERLAALACEHIGLRTGDRRDPTLAHPAPHVLIGGLGLGFTLRAALDCLPHSARVTVAELLPEIIAWNHEVLAPLTGHPLKDPRVSVACTDIATLLQAASPATFDAIVLDTDNGPESVMLAGNDALYRPETLRLIRRVLRPGGSLAVWSADPSPRFEHDLRSAGFRWSAHDVPARGAPDDPLHTIYLARDTIGMQRVDFSSGKWDPSLNADSADDRMVAHSLAPRAEEGQP
jgi:SAM-dependent methyltransferase